MNKRSGKQNKRSLNGASTSTTPAVKEPESIEGVLENLSKTDPKAVEVIAQHIEVKSHRGPMPCPEDLKEYSLIDKDLPSRMMTMAEKSQSEKSSQNEKILGLKEKEIGVSELEVRQAESAHKREIGVQKRSLNFAFMTVLVCILGSFYMATIGETSVALVIGGTTVVGIVGAFLIGKKEKAKT